MKDETFAKWTASIKEAGENKAGRRAPSRMYEIKPPDIRMVRERLDVSQDEFAVMIGVSTRTLQNWEHGRRQPGGGPFVNHRAAGASTRGSRLDTSQVSSGLLFVLFVTFVVKLAS